MPVILFYKVSFFTYFYIFLHMVLEARRKYTKNLDFSTKNWKAKQFCNAFKVLNALWIVCIIWQSNLI